MIEFMVEHVEMPKLDFEKVSRWIKAVASYHGYTVGNVTYCFCDDPYILDTNRQFLNHDYFTDIITFDYTRATKIGGDMVISLETVATNAEGLGVSYDSELMRVIIHGILHLCGINDKGPGEREIMEKYENHALQMWNDNSYEE